MFGFNSLAVNVGEQIGKSLGNLWKSTGLYDLVVNFTSGGWQNLVMIAIACVLVYLAVKKGFEPLLLLPIAFGMFIVNIPGVYRILFGTKGYVVTDTLAGEEIARGTLAEIQKFFGQENLSYEALTALFETESKHPSWQTA